MTILGIVNNIPSNNSSVFYLPNFNKEETQGLSFVYGNKLLSIRGDLLFFIDSISLYFGGCGNILKFGAVGGETVELFKI